MSSKPSAEIIAFPMERRAGAAKRPASPTPAPVTSDAASQATGERTAGQIRLQRALAQLDEALAEQRRAVARWRGALADLHGSVQGLGASLRGYQQSLGDLSGKVGHLNHEARQLEAWADGVLNDEAVNVVRVMPTQPGAV